MRFYLYIAITFFLASCLQEYREGLILNNEDIEKVKLGMTKSDVISTLGTPSITLRSKNNGNILAYIQIKKKYRSFFNAKTISQDVLELEFIQNKLVAINRTHTKNETKPDHSGLKTNITIPKKGK